MKKPIVVLIAIVAIGIAGYFIFQQVKPKPRNEDQFLNVVHHFHCFKTGCENEYSMIEKDWRAMNVQGTPPCPKCASDDTDEWYQCIACKKLSAPVGVDRPISVCLACGIDQETGVPATPERRKKAERDADHGHK